MSMTNSAIRPTPGLASVSTPCFTHSVVIPFYNEAGNVIPLLNELREVENQLGARWEYILINDCSTDETGAELTRWASDREHARLLQTPRNLGQASALNAGLIAASAPLIITMDGDGQNVPADISTLLPLLAQADMVVGIRAQRRDTWIRRRMSRIANSIRGKVLGDGMRDSGCALKVFHQRVRHAFVPIKTMYSFMPAMAVAGGFTVAQRPVQHRIRSCGRSSYGLRAFAWRPLVDMLGMWWFVRRSLNTSLLAGQAESAPGPQRANRVH
ncbi:MAG TPA: glycosyltransferase family 2 protein [Kiritimatiellia bacterium]|nr:glycosyltransferase family 2 protein [Kiritimatiellia bacterium]